MLFPRLPRQIGRSIFGRWVVTSPAKGIDEGSAGATLTDSIGEELSYVERTMKEVADGYFFKGEEEVVLARVDTLPPEFPRRLPALPAIGGGLRLRRADASIATSSPAGSIVLGRSDKPGIQYVNRFQVQWEELVDQVPLPGEAGHIFMCTTDGSVGSGPPGCLDIVISSGPNVNIVSVEQTEYLKGRDIETIASLAERAAKYHMALQLAQPEALESLVVNWKSSVGERFPLVRAVPSLDDPGYTEVVVSTGASQAGYRTPALTTTGVVPALDTPGQRYTFYFDGPACRSRSENENVVKFETEDPDTGVVTPYPQPQDNFFVHEEGNVLVWRGSAPNKPTPGHIWRCFGFQKYAGPFVELQDYLADIATMAGLRVRVVDAPEAYIDLDFTIRTLEGFIRARVLARCRAVLLRFVENLRMGEAFSTYKAGVELSKVPGVDEVTANMTNKNAGSLFDKFVTDNSRIRLR